MTQPNQRRAVTRLTGQIGGGRQRVVLVVLSFAMVTALGAGAWGMFGLWAMHRNDHRANVGDTLAIAGGLFRVDSVAPEQMASMGHRQFAKSGMNMSNTGMDMVPDGYKRFKVSISLTSRAAGGLRYAPEDFQIVADGSKATGAVRAELGSGVVPNGSAVSGALVFQVPQSVTEAQLHFGGQVVILAVGAQGQDHAHEPTQPHSHASSEADGHAHDHQP